MLPITPAGHRPLFQKECSGNANGVRNNTTSRLRLRFSIEGVYPEIECDRRAADDFGRVNVRARNGVKFRARRVFGQG